MKKRAAIRGIRNHFYLPTLLLCLCGLLLNYALSQLVLLLRLPLYLDNIGSVLVAALGGPLAGMTVGFVSNLANALSEPITLYYGILTVFIALTAAIFSYMGWLKQLRGALCAAGLFVLIGGALGSCMTWMLYGGGIGEGISAPYATALLGMGLPEFWAQFTADVLLDIPDKLITVLVVYAFLKHYPRALYNKFSYSYLYDRSSDACAQEGQRRRRFYRKHSVTTRILTVLIVGLFSISTCSTVVGIVLARQDQQAQYKTMANSMAILAANVLSGDRVEQAIAEGPGSAAYTEQRALLQTLKENTGELEYLYVYQIREDGCHVLFDLDTAGMPGDAFGFVRAVDPAFERYLPALLRGETIEPILSGRQFDRLITAYAPVRNSAGETVAYAGADITLRGLRDMTLSYIIKMFAVQFGLAILLISYTTWYANRKVVEPVGSIVELSQAFSQTDPAQWLQSEAWQNRQDIRTGDEIEELYKTVCTAEENTAHNVIRLKHSEALERANEELAAAIEKAEEANRAKSTFLSRMSHDIRTPLNVIIGMSKLARENDNPADTQECLEKIRLSGDFLLGLVNDILDMERIESGKTELHLVPYSEEEFRTYIETVILPLCTEKGIDFRYTTGALDPVPVLQDKLRINQIYFNLLSNAVKFTPEGGRIELHLENRRLDEDHLEITSSVTDSGIGMSEEFQKHMFESFTQENRVMTSVSQGSGLGLSIVKHMCDLMGMTVSVSSAPGKGTTYRLHGVFAVAKETAAADLHRAPAAADETILQDKIILVCEDHMLNQEIIKRILQHRGMVAVIVENGQKGLEAFTQSAPGEYAAILMDVRMPVMDGLEATAAIRALDRPDAKTVPIIAMSANAYAEDVEKSLQAGMNAHLSKPVDTEILFRTLREFIR